MGLFDRFKKKAEELYNDVASSIQGFMNRNEKVDSVSTIPTAPVGNSKTTAISDHIKNIDNTANLDGLEIPKTLLQKGDIKNDKQQPTGKITVPADGSFKELHSTENLNIPKELLQNGDFYKKPTESKTAHLTFFKGEEYLSSMDSLKQLMKSHDLSELESDRSQQVVQFMKNKLYSLDDKMSFASDVEYNAKKDELRDLVKGFSNKIQTMRFEHESLDQLERASMHLGSKDSQAPDEATLIHRIRSWSQIKDKVDTYGDHYEFQSDKFKDSVLGFKENVENNPYITCSKLMNGETTTDRLNLDSLSTLKNLKTEFENHDINGTTFKKMLDGIQAYKEYEKLDDSFKTPRMQSTADNFRAKAEVFCKIADSLQKTGTIPELEKGLNIVLDFDKLQPAKVKNEGPKHQKATI